MKIVLAGGGTGGSVTPLLALADEIRKSHPETELVFIGTKNGPEQGLVREQGIPFRTVASGKLRRYADWRNVTDLLQIIWGFLQALAYFLKWKPDLILGAGGYVEVPVMWAGKLAGARIGIHQQDVEAGLANRLVAPIANQITAAYEYPSWPFPKSKTTITGNPVRSIVRSGNRTEGMERLHLDGTKPVVLVMGGGTGAQGINNLLRDALPNLVKFCQVIHVTGKDKDASGTGEGYQSYAFLPGKELADAYAASDLIIARAGLSTITECIALKKPTILIPLPESHQEANAAYFAGHGAFLTLPQRSPADRLIAMVQSVLNDQAQQTALQTGLEKLVAPDAAKKVLAVHMEKVKRKQ